MATDIAIRSPIARKAKLSKWAMPALLFIVTVVALGVRFVWFPFIARDYQIFLQPWFEEIKVNGGFLAIGQPIGDYLPSYIYILAALTYLPINSLYSIKLVSCICDIIMACFAMKIVLAKTGRKTLAFLVYTVLMLMPTMWMNSGVWGQCDSMYTAAIAACIYYMLIGKENAGMVAFAIAFIFKLQAVFLAPFILLLWMKGKVRFAQLLYVPIAYIIVILPAALAGRSLWDLLTIYFRLAGSYSSLSMNAPNLYAFISAESTIVYSVCGIVLFLAFMVLCFSYLRKAEFAITQDIILKFAMLSVVAVPFLLPHMHERYFYPADMLGVVYAAVYPKRWFVPVIIVGSSALVYGMYLFGAPWMNAAYAAVPMFLVLCALMFDVRKAIAPYRKPGVPG